MSKCLATFGVGPSADHLRITRPAMMRYAEMHGYDFTMTAVPDHRPPSWWKVPMLRKLLQNYDEVLWLDADVLIRRGDKDIANSVHEHAFQGMVLHHVPGPSYVPNCGVWFLRKRMIEFLGRMDTMSEYDNHCNWEQAALIKLLGGDPDTIHKRPMRPWDSVSELEMNTDWLPYEWNLHPRDVRKMPRSGRFWHATQFEDRLATLTYWRDQ